MGLRIKTAREKASLTQDQLALQVGVAKETLSKYENGHRTPDAAQLNRMVNATDCDPAWLLTGHEHEERAPAATDVVCDPRAAYGPDSVTEKIVIMLKDMPEEARLEILRSVEEKKLLRELLEERKKLKDAG